MKTIQVALLGLGTVGSGTFEVIMERQKDLFVHKVGADILVKTILVRHPDKYRSVVPDGVQLTADINDVLNDPAIDIVVEVMGGIEPAKIFYRGCLPVRALSVLIKI